MNKSLTAAVWFTLVVIGASGLSTKLVNKQSFKTVSTNEVVVVLTPDGRLVGCGIEAITVMV
jgi:hypothetical protein